MIKKIYKLISFACVLHAVGLHGMNLLRPYDTLVRPPFNGSSKWQVAAYAEGGVGTRAFDSCTSVCDVLHIWQDQQNALAMLDGFDANSPIGQLRTKVDANDNGTRGHLIFNSDFKVNYAVAFSARALFLQHFSFALYVPVYSMQLSNVHWCDLTAGKDDADVRVKECLTDHLASIVCDLGDGLDLGGWKRSGAGDVVAMLEWLRNFPQQKPLLKNVFLNWRLGLGIPTGKRVDPDKLFALPFGNDGATSLLFGFNLELTFGEYFKCGVDVELTHIFDQIRVRRIKTAFNQPELLLLQKAEVHKDFGLSQKFNLYFDAYKLFKGLSVKVGYQYFKQGEDTLAVVCNDYSSEIANSALSLQDYTMHQIVVNGYYDFSEHMQDSNVKPYLSVYARLPFNGKRVTLERMVGVVCAVNF